MLAQDVAQGAHHQTFSGALDFAAHDDGDLALLGGPLHHVGHPIQHICEMRVVAVANDGSDVFLEQCPCAGPGRDAEIPPQVEHIPVLLASTRVEHHSADVLFAMAMMQPDIGDRFKDRRAGLLGVTNQHGAV